MSLKNKLHKEYQSKKDMYGWIIGTVIIFSSPYTIFPVLFWLLDLLPVISVPAYFSEHIRSFFLFCLFGLGYYLGYEHGKFVEARERNN
jgi:hypothetical protein